MWYNLGFRGRARAKLSSRMRRGCLVTVRIEMSVEVYTPDDESLDGSEAGIVSEQVMTLANSILSELQRVMDTYAVEAHDFTQLTSLITSALEELDFSLTGKSKATVQLEQMEVEMSQLLQRLNEERESRQATDEVGSVTLATEILGNECIHLQVRRCPTQFLFSCLAILPVVGVVSSSRSASVETLTNLIDMSLVSRSCDNKSAESSVVSTLNGPPDNWKVRRIIL